MLKGDFGHKRSNNNQTIVSLFEHLTGSGVFASINGIYASVFSPFDPSLYVDMRDMDISIASLIIVALMLALMMTGMPLGVVTLFVSILSAVAYFGYGGLYLVSTNAFGLLEKYPLVAVPLFVLMASILERAGIAEDLFDAMSILLGNLEVVWLYKLLQLLWFWQLCRGYGWGNRYARARCPASAFKIGLRPKNVYRSNLRFRCSGDTHPPSIIMIIYGLSAQVAIGDLFMAGAVPGLMLATLYGIYVLIRVNINPAMAPTAEE